MSVNVDYQKDADGYAIVRPIPQLRPAVTYEKEGVLVRYNEAFLPKDLADRYFEELKTLEESATHEKNPFTKKDCKRKTLQFADPGVRVYKYSTAGATSTMRWEITKCMPELLDMIELATGTRPNFCLVNFYTPDAQLAYHSDDENDMVDGSTVASISLGTVRRFKMRDKQAAEARMQFIKDYNMWEWMLAHGSLLTMEGECQHRLQHSVPPMVCEGMRINCTFRSMKYE